MHASGIGPVEVCVHPRADRVAIAAVLPDGWTIGPTTTTRERLEAGDVAVVIQRASGAGLDALWMGIPVVELVDPGRPSNYASSRTSGCRR